MSEEIIKILDDLAQRFGIAIDWTAANVMPYLQDLFDRFILWEIWTSVVWLALGVLMIVIPLAIFVHVVRQTKKDEDYDGDWFWDLGVIFALISFVLGVIISMCQIFDIVEALTIPEKTLIDYINYMKDSCR